MCVSSAAAASGTGTGEAVLFCSFLLKNATLWMGEVLCGIYLDYVLCSTKKYIGKCTSIPSRWTCVVWWWWRGWWYVSLNVSN